MVERLQRRSSPLQVAELVVKQNPRLRDLEDLVGTVLRFSWQVRKPSDLAFRASIQHSILQARCISLGLKRVEHFITLVRWLAFGILTSIERMSARRARLVVGISDPSNFRRQLRRLAYLGRIAGAKG